MISRLFGISASEFLKTVATATSQYDKNRLEKIKRYIAANKNDPRKLNTVDDQGNTALILAVKVNCDYIVQELLAHPLININTQNHDRKTALSMAVSENYTKIVKKLLARTDIDINCRSSFGNTPLIEAAENGNITIVEYILAMPSIDINQRNNARETARQVALSCKYKEIADLILIAQESKKSTTVHSSVANIQPTAPELKHPNESDALSDVLLPPSTNQTPMTVSTNTTQNMPFFAAESKKSDISIELPPPPYNDEASSDINICTLPDRRAKEMAKQIDAAITLLKNNPCPNNDAQKSVLEHLSNLYTKNALPTSNQELISDEKLKIQLELYSFNSPIFR